MTDQQGRDIACILLIGTVVVLSAMGHLIPPMLQEWADTAFGFLFGAKTASYSVGGKVDASKVALPIALVFLLLSGGTAKADIFKPLPSNPQYKSFLSSVNGVSIDGNLLNDVTQVVNYLGAKEGRAYNFNAKKWVTTSGATIISYTPWNLALDADLLNTDGFGGSIDWNIGNYLPVQNVPVMQYTQYLSVFAGAGAENDANSDMKFASYVGLQFKLTFGPSSGS